MPKPKKTKIKLDNDSFETLLQEIYNDIQSVAKQARSDIEERNKTIKPDSTYDVAQLGKVNNESLKILDSQIDKKLSLAKLQSQSVNNDGKKSDSETGKSGMTNDDKKAIRELLKNGLKKNNAEFEDE